MNDNLLKVYSFLMHKSIPFKRYCHASCTTDSEWMAILKKMNVPCSFVHTSIFSLPDENFLCFLQELSESKENSSEILLQKVEPVPILQKERIFQRFDCNENTLSPLAFVLDLQNEFSVTFSDSLRESEYLCFPCIDDTESIIMSYSDFLEYFIPATGIKIIQ